MFAAHQTPATRRILDGVLLLSLLVVAGVTTFYAAYAPASADDYCRAALRLPGSWWDGAVANVADTYRTWSGRWVAHGIYGALFSRLGITSIRYNLLIALSPILWMVFFGSIIHIVFRDSLSRARKLYLAAVVSAVYFAGLPGASETWFWLTGWFEYQLAVVACGLCVVVAVTFVDARSRVRQASAVIGASALAILTPGLHEIAGLMVLLLLSLGVIAARLRRRNDVAVALGVVFMAGAIGLAINLFAPGTAGRVAIGKAAGTWAQPNLVSAVKATFVEPRVTPLHWLGDTGLIWLTFLTVTSPWFYRVRPQWTNWNVSRRLLRPVIVLPIFGLAATILCVFVVAYGQGGTPPNRVLDIAYALFVAMWLGSIAAIPVSDTVLGYLEAPPTRVLNVIAGVMLPISLVTAPNVSGGIADLHYVQTAMAPAIRMRDRDVRSRVAAGEKDLVLDPITYSMRLYFWYDLALDPADWRNVCFSQYYGVNSVRVASRRR
jgi:hypothetical protein